MYEKRFINIRIIFKKIFKNTMTNEWGKKVHLILILKEILTKRFIHTWKILCLQSSTMLVIFSFNYIKTHSHNVSRRTQIFVILM